MLELLGAFLLTILGFIGCIVKSSIMKALNLVYIHKISDKQKGTLLQGNE